MRDPELAGIQPSTRLLRTAEYGNGRFLLSGDDGTRLVSADGAAWTAHPGDPADFYKGSTFANGLFYIVGIRLNDDRLSGTGIILSSADGETWTQRMANTTSTLQDIAHGNGLFVAVAGSASIPAAAQAFTSTDGNTWRLSSIGARFWPYAIAYGNGLFVGVGGSQVFRSLNGTNWTVDPAPNGARLTTITFDGSAFKAAGLGGIIGTSADGSNWTTQQSVTTNDLWSIAYGGGYLAAAGNNGTIVVSQSGAGWSVVNSGGAHVRALAFGGDRFVASGWYGVTLRSGAPCAPRISLRIAPRRELQVWGPVGRRYRIEYAPSPNYPAWAVLTEISAMPTSPYTVPDTTPWHRCDQFYRAVLLP